MHKLKGTLWTDNSGSVSFFSRKNHLGGAGKKVSKKARIAQFFLKRKIKLMSFGRDIQYFILQLMFMKILKIFLVLFFFNNVNKRPFGHRSAFFLFLVWYIKLYPLNHWTALSFLNYCPSIAFLFDFCPFWHFFVYKIFFFFLSK